MVFTEYPKKGIIFFVNFDKTMQYPFEFQIYVMKPNVFLGYLKRGIARSLSPSRHEQYPFDSLDQNNSAHSVYGVPQ
jgi:hypothetical protein